ncbi:FPGS1 [Acrasis kona]|uniref:FPGS1 n=1 Tax=Acrasis kona TaxID=1008807 RepID=A0AAW2Z6S8_9EUKA
MLSGSSGSANNHNAGTSLFSSSSPFQVKRTNSQPSVSFAPDPNHGMYDPTYHQYNASHSYPLPQYIHHSNGNNHHQHHNGTNGSFPQNTFNFSMPHNHHHHSHHMGPPTHQPHSYDPSQNWFDLNNYQSQPIHSYSSSPHQNQQPVFSSPTRPVSVKSPKSKSYPSSPIKTTTTSIQQQQQPTHAITSTKPIISNQHSQSSSRQQIQPMSTSRQQIHANGSSTSSLLSQSSTFHLDQQSTTSQPTIEGSRCRGLYKEFAKEVKDFEKQGYKSTKDFVLKNMSNTPSSVHWRVYMDLADFAKRENMISEARKWFKKVNELQPSASQGWLEHAKLEEECGRLEHCEFLLIQGLDHCPQNESLLVKAIKHFEQVQQVDQARALLSRLRNMSLEKSWKIMLEGALFESRLGNVQVARKVFQYLMQHVSRHGPIYYEAYRLEEKCEEWEFALQIVERGLEANPRYGPLWFAAFHLYEKKAHLSASKSLESVRSCLERAIQNISKELIWKVHFEQAQIEERSNHVQESRKAYCKSVVASMPNLRWKVWLAGSRTELNQNNIAIARSLLNRALEEVPVKTRAVVLIECARLEEYTGDLKKARSFLKRAQHEAKHEWKVFLESILLEMRAGEHQRAIQEAQRALKIHRGTGRLWAVLIQLKGYLEGPDAQLKVFREALDEVPKSGEVWCEGARIRLNPLTNKFNLDKARKYLDFAIKFTPQYGDSFIEYLRLELLTRGPCVFHSCVNEGGSSSISYDIEQLCVNADPNYGPLWFHCKENVLDSTRQVLRRAKKLLMAELLEYRDLYQRAIMCNDSHVNNTNQEGCKDFITGLHELNMTHKSESFDMSTRKKYIYGFEICV